MKHEDFSNQAKGELSRLLSEDGGFASLPGAESRPEATAWGLLALRFLQVDSGSVLRSARKLQGWQDVQGGLASKLEDYAVVWPTSLAVIAWTGIPEAQEARDKALDFLLGNTVSKARKVSEGGVYSDPDLAGWPWNNKTYSWVAPTSVALIALKSAGREKISRYNRAIQMLLQRQLPSGGWNFGNTVVFDSELPPLPDTTGMALCALAGEVEPSLVQTSLNYLKQELPQMDSPAALGWGLLALKAWKMACPDVARRAGQSMAKAVALHVLTCESIGLLTLAVAVEQSLPQTLQSGAGGGLK